MSSITRLRRAGAVAAATAVITLVLPSAAHAATYDVWGTLNTGGALVQYSTFRSHISGGASLRIYDNVGTYSRFGLRDTGGTQVTNSNQYNGSGGDAPFTLASNGSTTIPTGSYALNGRMGAQSGADNYWAGTLNL